jgi:hypothetical protein
MGFGRCLKERRERQVSGLKFDGFPDILAALRATPSTLLGADSAAGHPPETVLYRFEEHGWKPVAARASGISTVQEFSLQEFPLARRYSSGYYAQIFKLRIRSWY